MASRMPVEPADQAALPLRTIVPFFLNDLETVIEARCPDHGGQGTAPNLTAVILCLAACEVLADLDGDPTLRRGTKDRRRAFFRTLAELVGDSRYGELGEILFVVFRHGIAHTFLPKLTEEVGGSVAWILRPDGRSQCIAEVERTIDQHRFGEHLRLDVGVLTVYAQVLYLDIRTMLRDFEARLEGGDPVTLQRLATNFPGYWNDNATIESRALDQAEWALLQGKTAVTPVIAPPLSKHESWIRDLDAQSGADSTRLAGLYHDFRRVLPG
jgi:hypothetical protein